MATPDISPGSVSLEWIGATLRTIQAEQRSVRDENKLIRSALSEAITLMMARIAGSKRLWSPASRTLSDMPGNMEFITGPRRICWRSTAWRMRFDGVGCTRRTPQ